MQGATQEAMPQGRKAGFIKNKIQPTLINKMGVLKKLSLFLFAAVVLQQLASAQITYFNVAVQYDSPWVCKNLKLIPVRFKGNGGDTNQLMKGGVISFEEAFKKGKITVKESDLGGGADVRLITVKNHSKENVLVHSGDIVAGGKQDRAFAGTTILGAEEEQYMPVFCVEKGRWTKKPHSFRYGGQADASLKKQIDVVRKQNKVWKEIDRQLNENDKKNASSAYLNRFAGEDDIDSTCFRMFTRKLAESDSMYSGFITVTGKRIINCELFSSADLFVASFHSLIKSYQRSVTPKDGKPELPDETVKAFMDKFMETEEKQKAYLNSHGRLYTIQNHVIHLVAYDE